MRLGPTFFPVLFLLGTGLVTTTDAECSVNAMLSCLKPVTEFIVSDEGTALMMALGPHSELESAPVARLSDDQLVQACVMATNVLPCMKDPLADCLAILSGAGRELMAVYNRSIKLRKTCRNPDFASKARTVISCSSRLASESPKYKACYSDSASIMLNMFKSFGGFDTTSGIPTAAELDRQTSAKFQKACCNEQRHYTCSMGEVSRVCGSEAADIFEDLHQVTSEMLQCSAYECETHGQLVPSASRTNAITNSASSNRDKVGITTGRGAPLYGELFVPLLRVLPNQNLE